MRTVLILIATFVLAAALSASARAQNYPWCAYYGGHMGGSANCGFVSYDQCMTTLSGMGGFCARNTQYVPPRRGHRPD